MEGGEIMQYLSAIISAVIANVVGHYVCKWLDRISLSGSWKTLHGVVKRSLMVKMITSIVKRRAYRLVFLPLKSCIISTVLWLLLKYFYTT